MTYVNVFINREVWESTIGKFPDVMLTGISTAIEDNIESADNLSPEQKHKLIVEFWERAGGMGGYKRGEKLRHDLFTFSIDSSEEKL